MNWVGKCLNNSAFVGNTAPTVPLAEFLEHAEPLPGRITRAQFEALREEEEEE